MKKIMVLLIGVGVCLFSGCATIANGTDQKITVLTPPIRDAQCALENDKGKWHIDNTPGQIIVRRSEKKLVITCQKKAFNTHSISIKPTLSKMIYGNVFVGGVIGSSVDRYNGSAYDYPSEIKVPMSAEKENN